jgi:hypothetical protein
VSQFLQCHWHRKFRFLSVLFSHRKSFRFWLQICQDISTIVHSVAFFLYMLNFILCILSKPLISLLVFSVYVQFHSSIISTHIVPALTKNITNSMSSLYNKNFIQSILSVHTISTHIFLVILNFIQHVQRRWQTKPKYLKWNYFLKQLLKRHCCIKQYVCVQLDLKRTRMKLLIHSVRYHCGGWSEEVNSCILISYMVYL